jgi:hypothetical protein
LQKNYNWFVFAVFELFKLKLHLEKQIYAYKLRMISFLSKPEKTEIELCLISKMMDFKKNTVQISLLHHICHFSTYDLQIWISRRDSLRTNSAFLLFQLVAKLQKTVFVFYPLFLNISGWNFRFSVTAKNNFSMQLWLFGLKLQI